MSNEINDLVERLLRCLEESETRKDDLDEWTNSLEELAEIEDAFEVDERKKLHGKTVLDIGTDCIKPLYIALKLEPKKILGINENFNIFAFDIQQKSKLLLSKTKISFYNCNFFDQETLMKIRTKEKTDTFDFVLLSKTLHHLRTGQCIAKERDKKHDQKQECGEVEKSCIYKFEEDKIFKNLLRLGKRVIVYEPFYPRDEDEDKVRGRGGYFTVNEWIRIFDHLSENYRTKFITPSKLDLYKKNLQDAEAMLRQVDTVCFYVEMK